MAQNPLHNLPHTGAWRHLGTIPWQIWTMQFYIVLFIHSDSFVSNFHEVSEILHFFRRNFCFRFVISNKVLGWTRFKTETILDQIGSNICKKRLTELCLISFFFSISRNILFLVDYVFVKQRLKKQLTKFLLQGIFMCFLPIVLSSYVRCACVHACVRVCVCLFSRWGSSKFNYNSINS